MSDQPDLLAAPAPVDSDAAPASVFDLLRRRHPAGEWAYLEEVAPRTGGGTRYADAVAVNLWNSRGHAVHGFEVKVSRSDWLRELKQPAKAEEVYVHCDHWWLVTEKGIVKDGELPVTWGHLERRGGSLYTVKAAPRLEPKPLTRGFFASLVRRSFEGIERKAGAIHIDKVAELRAEYEKAKAGHRAEAQRELERLKARIADFEKKTGLSFTDYAGPPIEVVLLAQKINALSGWRSDQALHRLIELAEGLERAAVTVRDAITNTGLVEPTTPESS